MTPQDRRTEILDRALALFARHGYAGTGMRAIAQASGIREATLYHYFPTKEALMDAVIEHHASAPDFFREVMPRGLPLRDLLFGAAIGFLEAMRRPESRQFLQVMLVEAHHHAGWAQRYLETLYQPPLEALVESLEDAGAKNARWVAESFAGALLSYLIHKEFLADGEPDDDRIAYIRWLADQAARSAAG